MNKIAIVTDTDSSLPPELAAQYGIYLVPINVHFGQECFESGVDIDEIALFERVDREQKLPTTSAPTPGKFLEIYHRAFDDGADEVLCFCVSSEISATYTAALAACEGIPDAPITVVDSRNISMGQGFMALEAAKAVQSGASCEEAIAAAQHVCERTHTYAALATLKYLAMSGRVSRLTAGMANLLDVRPILTMQDGKLDMLEKVRTRRKAWGRIIEHIAQSADGKAIEQLAFIHVNAAEDVQKLEGQLREVVACPETAVVANFTAGLSVHTGAGLVGIIVVTAP